MPTYDYLCKTCGFSFERFESITGAALAQCPADVCPLTDEGKGKGQVERQISGGAGLVFRGQGFYLTDYVRGKDADTGKGSGATAGQAKPAGSTGKTGSADSSSAGSSSADSSSAGSSSSSSGSSAPAPSAGEA